MAVGDSYNLDKNGNYKYAAEDKKSQIKLPVQKSKKVVAAQQQDPTKPPPKKKGILEGALDSVNDFLDERKGEQDEYYSAKRNRAFDTKDGKPSAWDTLRHTGNVILGAVDDAVNDVRGRPYVSGGATNPDSWRKGDGTRPPVYSKKKK